MSLHARDAIQYLFMRAAGYWLTLLLFAGCAVQRAPTGTPTSPPVSGGAAARIPAVESPTQRVERATRFMQQGQDQEADRILRSVIDSGDFQTLDPAHRHQVLLLGARMALELDDRQRWFSLIKRACEFPQADSVEWFDRVRAAIAAHDSADAAGALVVLAKRWPEALPQFESSEDFPRQALARAVAALQESGSDADRYTVLRVLLDAHFPKEPGWASWWWRDLALLELERGEQGAAVATLARVTDPYVVISIEADKRFDPIRRELSASHDVSRTMEQAIAAALTEAQKNPASLRPMYRLIDGLRHSLRFEQALQVADMAIERQEAHGKDAYEDYEHQYVWILNDRAYALFSLGRWDAAVIQMETASRMSEDGDPNVSQTLNLALMYADLGRPAETLAALERAGRTSAYGNSVAQQARLKAAVQLNDRSAVKEALQFLSEHRTDSLSGYQEALLDADQEEEGAKLLISRLADPRLRIGALLAVQQYGEEILPPQVVLKKRRWQALIGRRDVQEAIRAVGYVKRYPVMYDFY